MHTFIGNHKLSIYIFFLILIGGFFRFYKLDWAQGLFTHPDEYHIASSVAQLSFPHQMHPHFFSYGTVTIYLIYFTQELIKYAYSIFNFQLFNVPFAQPIIPINYSKIMPSFETPLKNVYLANIQRVYPWDRGTNYAVELGEKVAKNN